MSQVAIVTGAGSGIGKATATLLAQRGFSVVLVGRREQPLRETATGLASTLIFPANISDAASCQRVISATDKAFGRIDVLVNNAGLAPLIPIQETGPSVIDEVFAVNALAPAYLINAAWPVFLRQRSGCIINISTLGTIDPFQGFFAYAAAKASVNLMALSCAKEGKEYGIRAFAIAPGAVETEMLRKIVSESKLPRHQTLAPQAVASVILECIEGKRDSDNGRTIQLQPPSK